MQEYKTMYLKLSSRMPVLMQQQDYPHVHNNESKMDRKLQSLSNIKKY